MEGMSKEDQIELLRSAGIIKRDAFLKGKKLVYASEDSIVYKGNGEYFIISSKNINIYHSSIDGRYGEVINHGDGDTFVLGTGIVLNEGYGDTTVLNDGNVQVRGHGLVERFFNGDTYVKGNGYTAIHGNGYTAIHGNGRTDVYGSGDTDIKNEKVSAQGKPPCI